MKNTSLRIIASCRNPNITLLQTGSAANSLQAGRNKESELKQEEKSTNLVTGNATKNPESVDSDWGEGGYDQNYSDSEPEEEVKRKKKKSGRRNVREYRRKKNFDKVTMISFEYDELRCDVCDIDYKSESGLWSHVFRKHGPHRQQECIDCDKVFTDQALYEKHKRVVHGERVSCPDCGKLL